MQEPSKRTGNLEIVAIKRQKANNIVYLSDGNNFPCDFETTLNNRLYVRKTLTTAEVKKILDETKQYQTLKKYIKYLNKYKVSRSFFKERLAKKEGLDEEQIKKIMYELDNKRHLFDDRTLREEYLAYYLSKGYSYKECEKKLANKRIYFHVDNFPFDEKIERENLKRQIRLIKPKYDKYGPLGKYKLRKALYNYGFKISLIDEELAHVKFAEEVDMDQARLDAMKQKMKAKEDKQKFYRGMERIGYRQRTIFMLMEEYFK